MQHSNNLKQFHIDKSWLAIGTFDGVHIGHQAIISEMTNDAHRNNASSVVLTFHPHPAVILGKRTGAFYLTHPDEKAAYLAELGVDIVITLPFDHQVANLTAYEFISRVKQHLGLRQLWAGHDFALGRNREGDLTRLENLGQALDYRLHIVDKISSLGNPVSSSKIRALLSGGNVEQASQLLGRPYHAEGIVAPGDGRGRTIGIPTANLDIWKEKLIPKPGVYVCKAVHQKKEYPAVTNIGFRPTFENTPPEARVEAHILDFDQDLYGQKLELNLFTRLRDEMRFPNVQALIEQIQHDIQSTRDYFTIHPILHR